MRDCRGLTLIELLVVIAIMAILTGVLLPALNRTREQGRHAACLNGLRHRGPARVVYADDKIVNGNTGKPGQGPIPANEDGWAHWAGYSDEASEQAQGGVEQGLRFFLLHRTCPTALCVRLICSCPIAQLDSAPSADYNQFANPNVSGRDSFLKGYYHGT